MKTRPTTPRKPKNVKEELAELALFPEMNPGPVCRLDRNGIVLLANAAARKLFGEDALLGHCWLDICPGMSKELWKRVLVSKDPLSHEAEVGNTCVMFTHVRPEKGDSLFVFGADITERRKAEKELAEVARFPDMNPGPVLRLDLDAMVLLANRAARDLFGEELVGLCWRDLCPAVDQAVWKTILGAAEPIPIEGRIGEGEYVFTHRRDLKANLVFVFGSDVTQQKRAERALRQSEKMATLGTLAAGVAHELNNPAAATRRAAEQLRDAFARLEQAHFRLDNVALTPAGRELLKSFEQKAKERSARPSDLDALTRSDREAEVEEWLGENGVEDAWELAPSLVAQGLTTSDLSKLTEIFDGVSLPAVLGWTASAFPVYALLHEIGQGSARVSEIVGALKSYSYLGQAPIQRVDLHEGLDNTLIILRNKLKTGIKVQRDYAADVPQVMAYGSELNQVWTNLLDNAADAMGGKGEIAIRTRRQDSWAVVEIEDNGPGIPEDIQTRIFDPFFTTKAPGKGTGLGLSNTYAIVTEKHKGEIRVESRPGSTRFIVRIPIGESTS